MADKRVKFTAKVKRGLVIMRAVVLDGLDPSADPLRWTMKRWTAAEQRDFNAALAWMEQVEEDLTPEPPPAPPAVTPASAACHAAFARAMGGGL